MATHAVVALLTALVIADTSTTIHTADIDGLELALSRLKHNAGSLWEPAQHLTANQNTVDDIKRLSEPKRPIPTPPPPPGDPDFEYRRAYFSSDQDMSLDSGFFGLPHIDKLHQEDARSLFNMDVVGKRLSQPGPVIGPNGPPIPPRPPTDPGAPGPPSIPFPPAMPVVRSLFRMHNAGKRLSQPGPVTGPNGPPSPPRPPTYPDVPGPPSIPLPSSNQGVRSLFNIDDAGKRLSQPGPVIGPNGPPSPPRRPTDPSMPGPPSIHLSPDMQFVRSLYNLDDTEKRLSQPGPVTGPNGPPSPPRPPTDPGAPGPPSIPLPSFYNPNANSKRASNLLQLWLSATGPEAARPKEQRSGEVATEELWTPERF